MMPRGRPRKPPPDKDMVLIWSLSCAELRLLKTGEDCDSCPDRFICQKQADKVISVMINRGFHGKRKERA